MSRNKVGELVLKAKGNRSYREYQRDSGVDAAVISKIVKGTYIPKSPEVYRKLTTCESNGVTFEDLVDAASYSAEYKNGMLAGAAATQAAISVMGATSLALVPGVGVMLGGLAGATGALLKANSKKTKGVDKVEEYLNKVQRFSAMSNGILFSKLAQNGILFQQNTTDETRLFDNKIDTYLDISNRPFSQYVIRYLYIDNEVAENEDLLETAGRRVIEELVFSAPDKERKISIVTDSRYVFEYLKHNSNRISYKGNLSIILLDIQKVVLVEEAFLSKYDESINLEEFMID